jgi:hypothetical protein
MAVTATIPGQLPVQTAAPLASWVADTIKCALVTSLAAYNQDTTVFWSTLQGAEVASGLGYTTGGQTLTGKSVTYNSTANHNRYLGTVPAWTATGAGFSAVGAVFFKDTGSAATSPICAVIDFGGPLAASGGGTLTLTVDPTDGVFYAAPA